MSTRHLFPIVCLSTVLLTTATAHAQMRVVHNFAGDVLGAEPNGSLVLDGNLVYGMTLDGGAENSGGVFKMNNSTGIGTLLRSFDFNVDGVSPYGTVTFDGTALYGMINVSVSGGPGAIFKMNTDGSDFDYLHSFTDLGDGARPVQSLTLAGSTLYGMTQGGGKPGQIVSVGGGTIFKINTDGTGYLKLHSFDVFDPNNGSDPVSDLTVGGNTLYGMTPRGGSYGQFLYRAGTIFKINQDGSGFTLLHSFSNDDPNQGHSPLGSLKLIGTTLYGTTPFRGVVPCTVIPDVPGGVSCPPQVLPSGQIFKINTDGSGYEILHTFAGGAEGTYAYSSLAYDGRFLYGVAEGTANAEGTQQTPSTLYQIKPDGTCFRVLHTFAGPPTESFGIMARGSALTVRRQPRANPDERQDGTTLFGATKDGGPQDVGTVFRMDKVNVPLAANAGADQTVEATSPAGALVTLGGTASSTGVEFHWTVPGVVLDDPDSATASGTFPMGQTVATLTVEDEMGCLESTTDDVTIVVQDTTPPSVSCSTTPAQLFPPNHRMISVGVAVCATDAATQLTLEGATASSNEADDAPGSGDGETVGDTDGRDGFLAPVDIAGKLTFNAATGCFEGRINLRAERAGTRRDRVYTIGAAVEDPFGNRGAGSCTVVVPHN